MRKQFLSLALAVALALNLSVPALAWEGVVQATGPDTFDDEYVVVTNVLEEKWINSKYGVLPVAHELTCVAPVSVQPGIDDSNGDYCLFDIEEVPEGINLKDLDWDGVNEYLSPIIGKTITEPGIYYMQCTVYDKNNVFVALAGYLLTVQEGEDTPAQPDAPGFTDVPSDAYYAEAVDWALKHDITKGTSDTTFSPDQTCSRAQIITFLWRAAGSPEPSGTYSVSDVSSGDYFYKAVLWAKETELFDGDAFRPNEPCTRLMAVEFIWKYMESPGAEEGYYYKAGFTDVSSNAVDWAVDMQITSGTSDTTFSPDQTCTRGQIVTFLYRIPVYDPMLRAGTYQSGNYQLILGYAGPDYTFTLYNTKYDERVGYGGFKNGSVGIFSFSTDMQSRTFIHFYTGYLSFSGYDSSGFKPFYGKYDRIDEGQPVTDPARMSGTYQRVTREGFDQAIIQYDRNRPGVIYYDGVEYELSPGGSTARYTTSEENELTTKYHDYIIHFYSDCITLEIRERAYYHNEDYSYDSLHAFRRYERVE